MISPVRHTLHRRVRPQRYACLQALLRTQALSRCEVRALQQRALVDIVAFARAHTRYYAARYPTLDSAADAASVLANLPILHKDDVRTHLDALLADTADRRRANIGHTGGSTGTPLAFWYDEHKHELMRAGMMRSYMLSGWRPGQKILNFWGAPQDVVRGGVFSAGVSGWIAAEQTIAAFNYSEAQLRAWANFIPRYRPVLLQGYASILAELARVVIAHRVRMPKSLRGVYSTAEVLDDAQRALMRQAFGCKVFNQYGSREIPNIACECSHGKLHVFSDLVYLESLPGEDGDAGRLLVTSLTNRLMPFIRYDLGDSARLSDAECRCGLPFPLLEMGVCRQNDLIRIAGGRTVHPACFNRLLYGMTQIRQYQWVQLAANRMRLDLVMHSRLDPATQRALTERLRRDTDACMQLEIRYPEAIARTRSGKHRFVIGLTSDATACASP